MMCSRALACHKWSLNARALVAPSVSSRTASTHCPAHMYNVPITIPMRPRPLFLALSPTPPEPNPWIETRSAIVLLVAVLGLLDVLFGCCAVLAALIPDISSKVVGGVRVPCALEEAVLGSSVDNGPPELDGNTGIDIRWPSFRALLTGDSGLLVLGV